MMERSTFTLRNRRWLDRSKERFRAMIGDAARAIQAELAPNEQLLWSGKPRGGSLLRPADWFRIPVSVVFAAFSIFWESSVVGSGAPLMFQLWGIPFVAFGLYMLVGRFIYDAADRAKTTYGLTDQRVIIVRRLFGRNVKVLLASLLPDCTFDSNADGSGTITFGPRPGAMASGGGWPAMRGTSPAAPAFDSIENASDVFQMLRDVQMNELQPKG